MYFTKGPPLISQIGCIRVMGQDWISSVKQIADYEKRRPKKYRSCGWKFYDSYFRGARYGKILPQTDYMYYTTQAWGMLQKCWRGFKIGKSQDDFEKMKYYAEGIQKAQKELRLPVEIFLDLGIWDHDENSIMGPEENDSPNKVDVDDGYESEAQREWRKRIDQSYESPAQRAWRERIERYY